MKDIKERILKDGKVLPGQIVRVDSFLNHQIDPVLMKNIGDEIKRRFKGTKITRILTVEASGIAIAVMAGYAMNVPVVFAQKRRTAKLGPAVYSARVHSYTHNKDYDIAVSKNYLNEADSVLVVDDFLAMGSASLGLCNIVEQSGAKLAGVAVAIEKSFQPGGQVLRAQGIHVEAMARIKNISGLEIEFED
ncbi:MAG: xanthine phosphoribosyltransferase [Negativicutes bacterium]|jgi:xanthine phosphoribosyltransferase